MKKKKIAIFINSLSAGGAERVVSLLLQHLKDDLDIHLVLLNNNIEYNIPGEQKIFCLQQSPAENDLVKLIKLPVLARRYKNFCIQNNIEASFSFLKRANYINCLARIFGSPSAIIISERTYLSFYLRSLGRSGRILGRLLTKRLYPKADLIVPNSQLIKTDLEENFNIRKKYRVIYNPIGINAIQNAALINTDPSYFGSFTFISVGGFRSEKNYQLLIEAFNKIKDLDCNLLLVGKGEEEMNLKNKVNELGLGSRIHFPGFDNNPYKYMSKASCFVLTSNFEGFPNSIQEALACNLPVISTDCKSGPREILAPGTDIYKNVENDIEIAEYGILVPVNNTDMLAKAMRLIYTNSQLHDKLRSRSVERAKDFDIIKIAEEFKEILI